MMKHSRIPLSFLFLSVSFPLTTSWIATARNAANLSKGSSCLFSCRAEDMSACSRRRELLSSAIGTSLLLLQPTPSFAASRARVKTWPSLEYLEPIYELKLSVDALQEAITDPSNNEFVKKRLEKFFSGGLFSEKNFYAGLGVQYSLKMEYADSELDEYIRLDRDERFESMEQTLSNMNRLYKDLQANKDQKTLELDANTAKAALDRWFSLVPKQDVDRVAQLFVDARKADINRDGKLDDKELATLDETTRSIWKKRIDYVGG